MRKLAYTLSFLMGFLSLSQEILWIRLVGFANFGKPQAFAFTLTFYLLGIGLGALVGRKVCQRARSLNGPIVVVLFASALFDFLAPWLYAASMQHAVEIPLLAALLLGSALIKSILFPIVHELGTDTTSSRIGTSFSLVYISNIFGSTMGPLLTGFLLLDVMSLQTNFMLLAWLGLAIAVAAAILTQRWRYAGTGMAALALGLASFAMPNILIKLVANKHFDQDDINHLVENRNGIIHSYKEAAEGDIVLGGNAYDGRVNIDLGTNANHIDRTYVSMALHRHPRRVLIIGLSGGAWTRIASAFPSVERVDVVEINPGYIELIKAYSQVNPILSDSRLHIHIDDGRRWLKRNRDEKYDVIIMNTTYYWRAYTTNLVSNTFLEEARAHLNRGGLIAYNSTDSNDIVKTAASVFQYAYRYSNFVIASDVDIRKEWSNLLERIVPAVKALTGRAMLTKEERQQLEKIAAATMFDVRELELATGRPLEVVTEQNMIVEFKYGARFFERE